MNISIKELPSYEVAFVRHVGSYGETAHAWDKTASWAGQNELYPPHQYFIGISLDDPSTVEESALRYDACVTIPAGFAKENHPDMQFKTLAGGAYALYEYYGSVEQFGAAFQYMFGQWLPQSEYEADERPCLEFCMNNPADDPEGKIKVDLYIAIKKRA